MDVIILSTWFVGAAVIMMVVAFAILNLYRRLGPNQALVVVGPAPRTVLGGGTVVWPLIEKAQAVSLELMSIDLKPSAPMSTADGASVHIDAVIEAQIKNDEKSVLAAATSFGDRDIRHIRSIVSDLVADKLRSIIAANNSAAVSSRLNQLAEEVRNASGEELSRLGIAMRALRIKDLRKSLDYELKQVADKQQNTITNNTATLIGRIGIVSQPISTECAGTITYEIASASYRCNVNARSNWTWLPVNTPVVIVAEQDDWVFVEPWSTTHLVLPETERMVGCI